MKENSRIKLDFYPGIMSLKTANKDSRASLIIAWSSSLEICNISFKDLILVSGSASSAIPNSASLRFLLSNASSAVRSSFTSAYTKNTIFCELCWRELMSVQQHKRSSVKVHSNLLDTLREKDNHQTKR